MASNIESIIQRQVAFWEVRRRLAEEGGEGARAALAHLSEGPWITLSKQWGSGGVELAEHLARELKWQVFDREILSTIARHTDSMEAVLSRLDEHAIGSFNDYAAQLLVPRAPGQSRFLQEMVRVVWGLARQGHAVILGRGANWFLKPQFGLRVRTVAPLEHRAAHVSEKLEIGAAEAERVVLENDSQQAAFIRQVFGRDTDDPLGYDVVINLGSLDIRTASRILVEALKRKLDKS